MLSPGHLRAPKFPLPEFFPSFKGGGGILGRAFQRVSGLRKTYQGDFSPGGIGISATFNTMETAT